MEEGWNCGVHREEDDAETNDSSRGLRVIDHSEAEHVEEDGPVAAVLVGPVQVGAVGQGADQRHEVLARVLHRFLRRLVQGVEPRMIYVAVAVVRYIQSCGSR